MNHYNLQLLLIAAGLRPFPTFFTFLCLMYSTLNNLLSPYPLLALSSTVSGLPLLCCPLVIGSTHYMDCSKTIFVLNDC